MTQTRIVLTTSSADEARKLARELIEQRLAACVNIVSQVESVYRWQGKVDTAAECILVIKTEAKTIAALQAALHELHPYELPECLVLDVADGDEAYMAWIRTNVEPTASS
jgi:periplasmic divalent cation tolerance protein